MSHWLHLKKKYKCDKCGGLYVGDEDEPVWIACEECKSWFHVRCTVRDITKLSGYPRSNDKTRLEQSNYSLASGRFPLQNAIYDNKLPFSRMLHSQQT